jgi:enamine deaminase RidA (YjgF/YER057c/UK114 family)
MAKRIEVTPDWPWAEKAPFHPAIRVGDTVWVSGSVAWDRDGNIVGGDDMRAQSRQTFANVKEVLAAAGATMDDVVKITAFLTDMDRYAEYSAARAEAFPNNVPASTAVTAPVLIQPELLVEIEAVAVIGSG